MINLYFALVSTIISLTAFIYGICKLFSRRKPLYFQLLICAVGCLAIEQLYITVAIWCNNFNPTLNLGMIGFFGCNNFLLSANYGQLDSIIDDGSSNNNWVRKVALVAPIALIVLLITAILLIFKTSSKSIILFAMTLLPACFGSYFNLKHLLMPIDDFGFLKATRKLNLFALIFYALSAIYIYSIILNQIGVQSIVTILMSLSMLSIAIFAVEGAKQWAI